MPKTKNAEESAQALKQQTQSTLTMAKQVAVAEIRASELQTEAKKAVKVARTAEEQLGAVATEYQEFKKSAAPHFSRGTQLLVDSTGGLSAQAVNELLNWGIRAAADWSESTSGKEGLIYRNVDWLQSIPGGIGAALYLVEMMLLRPEYDPRDSERPESERRPFIPSKTRAGMTELLKILGHLGLSNTIRAMRFRYWESADERREKDEAVKNRDELIEQARAEIAALREQVKTLQAKE